MAALHILAIASGSREVLYIALLPQLGPQGWDGQDAPLLRCPGLLDARLRCRSALPSCTDLLAVAFPLFLCRCNLGH